MQRPAAAVVLTVVTLGLLLLFDGTGEAPKDLSVPLAPSPSPPQAAQAQQAPSGSDRTAPPAPFDAALRDYLGSAVDRRADEAELTRKELEWRREFPSPPLKPHGPQDGRGSP